MDCLLFSCFHFLGIRIKRTKSKTDKRLLISNFVQSMSPCGPMHLGHVFSMCHIGLPMTFDLWAF